MFPGSASLQTPSAFVEPSMARLEAIFEIASSQELYCIKAGLDVKLDTLGQGKPIAIVHRIGLASHIRFPRVRS